MERTLRELQRTSVGILEEFDRVCKKNNLRYYLGFGTLLGAVRHKGYIPWDDDIDLCMPRADYDRFMEKHYQEIAFPYQVCDYTLDHNSNYSFNFRVENSKVFIVRIVGGKETYVPSWISIFPIDGLPESVAGQKVQAKRMSLYYTLLRFSRSSLTGYGNTPKSVPEKIGVLLNNTLKIGKWIDPRKMAKRMNDRLKKYDFDTSDRVGIYTFDRYPLAYEKAWFGQPTEIMFENRLFPAPSDPDAFLRHCYGDYMKLPPKDQQKQSHSIRIVFAEDIADQTP